MPENENALFAKVNSEVCQRLNHIYSLLSEGTSRQEIVKPLINEVYHLGCVLSNAFAGSGEQLGTISSGALADDIVKIMLEHRSMLPSKPEINEKFVEVLYAIFNQSELLYDSWAGSGMYYTSTDEENDLVHAGLDSFKKGLYSLFALLDYNDIPFNVKAESDLKQYLFYTVIADEFTQHIISEIQLIPIFLDGLGPLSYQQKTDPLVKLGILFQSYLNFEISTLKFIEEFNAIVDADKNNCNTTQEGQAILWHSKNSDDNSSVTEPMSELSSVSSSSAGQFEEWQENLKEHVVLLQEKRHVIIQEIGYARLSDAMRSLHSDAKSQAEFEKLQLLTTHFLQGDISLSKFKQSFNALYIDAKQSSLNIKDIDRTKRKISSYFFSPVSGNKNAFMDAYSTVNKALSKLSEKQLGADPDYKFYGR